MTTVDIEIADHELLDAALLVWRWPAPLGQLASPPWLQELLSASAAAPLSSAELVRRAVRDLLRGAGYKPTGRAKPSSEYLLRAASDGALASINPAVDLGNAVSLHSGLPISVVDLERARAPLAIGLARAGASFVFNAAGQEIDVAGLLCLHDALGPCANAVKDAQRTKTDATTTRTLVIVWGTRALAGRTARAAAWLAELGERLDVV